MTYQDTKQGALQINASDFTTEELEAIRALSAEETKIWADNYRQWLQDLEQEAEDWIPYCARETGVAHG